MAKAKFLLLFTCRGSRLLSLSRSKKDAAATSPASSKLDITKSQEMIILLNNFPESESESDRELSFSFLLDNSSPEKNDSLEKDSNIDQCKEVTAVKEKKRRIISRSNCGSSRNGVLLNFPVPAYFIDNGKSRSGRQMPCTTLAELEKREIEFNRVGCWPSLLRRKQDHNKPQLGSDTSADILNASSKNSFFDVKQQVLV